MGRFRAWWLGPFLFAISACSGSDSNGRAENAVCASGQSTGCTCPNGLLPGATGCATVPAVMAGTSGTVPLGTSGAGAIGTAGNAGAPVPAGSGSSMTGAAGSAGSSLAGTGGSSGVAGSMPGMAGTGAGTGGASQAGSGGMAGSAGTTADAGTGSDVTDCGEGGMMGKASNAGAPAGRGASGHIRLTLKASNQILRLRTTLEVPVKPTGNSTLFIWPGLEPIQGGANYSPIGTGVLQPVLTWGGSCAPGSPRSGTSWWISAQYVNTLGSDPTHMGCHGGAVMSLEIGDQVLIDMSLNGKIWNQTLTNQSNDKAVDFDMDLGGQAQRWALFEIEMPTSTRPASDIVFTNTMMTFEKPEPEACQPSSGTNDYYSTPIASSDGLRCCVARLVLRAQGVAATTVDPPPP